MVGAQSEITKRRATSEHVLLQRKAVPSHVAIMVGAPLLALRSAMVAFCSSPHLDTMIENPTQQTKKNTKRD